MFNSPLLEKPKVPVLLLVLRQEGLYFNWDEIEIVDVQDPLELVFGDHPLSQGVVILEELLDSDLSHHDLGLDLLFDVAEAWVSLLISVLREFKERNQ